MNSLTIKRLGTLRKLEMFIVALILAQTDKRILCRLGEDITDHGLPGYGPSNVRTLRSSDASAARVNADNYRWYAQVSSPYPRGIRIRTGALYANHMPTVGSLLVKHVQPQLLCSTRQP